MTGTETRYQITVKTGDKRFAGTDANVFIQLAGVKGITKKLKLDDAKNNFERNMVDNFDVSRITIYRIILNNLTLNLLNFLNGIIHIPFLELSIYHSLEISR